MIGMINAVVIHAQDNVAVALVDIPVNSLVKVRLDDEARKVMVKQNIPQGHKFALTRIKKNQPVIKYGEIIGVTVSIIEEGEHVHVHNVDSQRGRGDLVRKQEETV